MKIADWVKVLECNCFFSPVKVVMKGSHGFISVTEWPLMIVSRQY